MQEKVKEQFKNDVMLAIVFVLFAILGVWFLFVKGPRESLSVEKTKLESLEQVEKDKQVEIVPNAASVKASKAANLTASANSIRGGALKTARSLGTTATVAPDGSDFSVSAPGQPLTSAKFIDSYAGRIRFKNNGQIINKGNKQFIVIKSLNITPKGADLVVSGR